MRKTTQRRHAFVLFWAINVLSLCLSLPGLLAEDAKTKAEDVIAKHLASIGTPEARANVTSRLVGGTVILATRVGGTGELSGKFNLISEGRKTRLGMNFSPINTSAVQIAFDGNKVGIGQVQPGQRSTLAQFIYENDVIVKEGLMGGALSTGWPLLDPTGRQAKLDYNGLKTIEGKQLHEVKYKAKKGGGDLEVYLYFEPENFRHVRTRYSLLKIGTEKASYYLLEQFDNFASIDGLTLPQTYKLEYSGDSGRIVIDWDATVAQILQNQEVDPKYFVVQH
jgi:hypothetical protein